jgi:hypothetical protein
MLIRPGDSARGEIRVRNYRKTPMKMEVGLIAPEEWRIEPDVLRFEAKPGSRTAQTFRLDIPRDWRPRSSRFAIAADVVCDGKYLGQITEAVIDLAL